VNIPQFNLPSQGFMPNLPNINIPPVDLSGIQRIFQGNAVPPANIPPMDLSGLNERLAGMNTQLGQIPGMVDERLRAALQGQGQAGMYPWISGLVNPLLGGLLGPRG
jgi:hypothetical protein